MTDTLFYSLWHMSDIAQPLHPPPQPPCPFFLLLILLMIIHATSASIITVIITVAIIFTPHYIPIAFDFTVKLLLSLYGLNSKYTNAITTSIATTVPNPNVPAPNKLPSWYTQIDTAYANTH